MAISEHTRGVSGAIGWALERLKTELPPHLHYHNLFHTELDVLPAARQLANDLALNVEETDLVLIAAAFHDIGFTRQYNDHERAGIDIAAGILPEFGLDDAQIAKISGMILATRLPQSAQTISEQILADADLDVLGRNDFMARNDQLRKEMAAFGDSVSERAWFTNQLAFMDDHHYFTRQAGARLGLGKRQNRAKLEARWHGAE